MVDFKQLDDIDELVEGFKKGRWRHPLVVTGSAISMGTPSDCPSVVKTMESVFRELARGITDHDLQKRILNDADDLYQTLLEVPFEEFCACLHAANANTTQKLVTSLFGSGQANANHQAIMEIVSALFDGQHIDRFTIATTNYDLGLDDVLGKFALQRIPHHPFPAYSASYGTGTLRYLKLHGCARAGDMVYTSQQMGRLLQERSWSDVLTKELSANGLRPDLCLIVGYGLGDVDLYDFFDDIFRGTNLVVLNERPGWSPPAMRPGRVALQSVFLDLLRMPINVFHSSLIGVPGEVSLLVDIRNRLLPQSSTLAPPAAPAASGNNQHLGRLVHQQLQGLDSIAIGRFWGRLFQAASRPEAKPFLRGILDNQARDRDFTILAAYLDSFGCREEWSEGVDGCDDLLKLDMDINSIIYVLCQKSFLLTMQGGFRRWLAGGNALLKARGLTKQPLVNDHARSEYDHHAAHFWIKTMLCFIQLRRLFRKPLEKLLASLESELSRIGQLNNPHLVGHLLELRTETLILLNKNREAQTSAREVHYWRALIARVSNTVAAERLLTWAHGADGAEDDYFIALSAAVRSFWLALFLPREPYFAKMSGASLLRLLWQDESHLLNAHRAIAYGIDEAGEVCRQLLLAISEAKAHGEKPQDFRRDLRFRLRRGTLTQVVLYISLPTRRKLIRRVRRRMNLQKFPMLSLPRKF